MKKGVKEIASFWVRTSKSLRSFLNAKIHCPVRQITYTDAVDTLDDLVYDSTKPNIALLSSVVPAWLGGAAGSVFADLFYSFGIGKTTFDTSSTYALAQNFKDYVEEKKSSYDTSTEEDLSKLLEPIGYMTDTGQLRTYDLSAKDVYDSSSFIYTLKDKTESTIAVPKAFLNTIRAFFVQKLNFNSVDLTAPVSYIYLSADDYYNLYSTLQTPFYSSNGIDKYYASGKVWVNYYKSGATTSSCYYYCKPGTIFYKYSSRNDTTLSWDPMDHYQVLSNGFIRIRTHPYNPADEDPPWPYDASTLSSIYKSYFGVYPSTISFGDAQYDNLTFTIACSYSAPSIDVEYANADAITWQGTPDLEQTLANQTQAATDGKREEYVNNSITTNGYSETSDDPVTDIGDIANRYGFRDIGDKGYGKCEKAAKEMKAYLEKNKLHGSVITLMWEPRSSGHIWSDYANKSVGDNGLHVGILYEGKVYCNVHPYGLSQQQWIDDFNCPYPAIKLPAIEVPF